MLVAHVHSHLLWTVPAELVGSDATVWARLALFGPRAHHGLAALLIELYGLWLALQKR